MGSWLSFEDFEEFDYERNDKNFKKRLEKKNSFYKLMDKNSPKDLFELADSFYYGNYHVENPKKIVDVRDAAHFYKKAYEKLLFYVRNLEIQYDSEDY